ncbi:MAG TPA: hypothetical protein VKA40_10395 [Nitrososphaera sp.]|nr:hypothetical protein [Nitrososphaera sp.]
MLSHLLAGLSAKGASPPRRAKDSPLGSEFVLEECFFLYCIVLNNNNNNNNNKNKNKKVNN